MVALMSFINENIKAARKESGLTQDEIARKLGVPRTSYATWEAKSDPEFEMIAAIAKLCGYEFKDMIDEDFLIKHQVHEPQAKYKRARKNLADVKLVDSDKLGVMDALQIKAMLRVLLRAQAEIIAKQEKKNVSYVLKEMTAAVRAETSEEFDEL